MHKFILAGCLGLTVMGCGLIKVRINGEEKTLGGEPTENAAQPTGAGKGGAATPSSAQGNARGEDAKQDDKAAARQARSDMLKLVEELDEHVIKESTPIDEAKLSALATKSKGLHKRGDEAGWHFAEQVLTYYRVENAWRGPSDESAGAIAKLMGGDLTISGEVSGKDKTLTFDFSLKAGQCYIVFSHLKKSGGEDDRLTNFWLEAGGDNASLQRFRVDGRRSTRQSLVRKLVEEYVYGACATADTKVSAQIELQYAGTQNGLRYAVVDVARGDLPMYVATDLEVILNDSCDADNWKSLWTNPIPGSIVYGESDPFLPFSVGHARELWMTAYTAAGGEARLMRRGLVSKPPSKLTFESAMSARACPRELKYAHGTMGKKVAGCYAGLDKRYDPQFDAAAKQRDNAPNIVIEYRARAQIDRLNAQYDAEVEKTCRPLEEQAQKKMEAAYNDIVDFYGKSPYASPLPRAEEMVLQYSGAFDMEN